jgi:hypothetical protein
MAYQLTRLDRDRRKQVQALWTRYRAWGHGLHITRLDAYSLTGDPHWADDPTGRVELIDVIVRQIESQG